NFLHMHSNPLVIYLLALSLLSAGSVLPSQAFSNPFKLKRASKTSLAANTPGSDEEAIDESPDPIVTSKGERVVVGPEIIQKHLNLGDRFYARHDFTNSMIEFQSVLKADPDNFKAHFMLGKILLSMGDYKEAVDEFNKAIMITPGDSEVHF